MKVHKVVIHSDGFRDLLKSPGVRREMERRAAAVAATARGTAPVQTGAYQASISSTSVDHPSRVVGRVEATADHALAVEANTGNLSRALDSGT